MTEWGALWQLWESWIVRLGTVVLMLVPICKYVLFPTVKGVRGFLHRAKEVSREVAEIRAHAASVSQKVNEQLTPNGGSSLVDKVNELTNTVKDVQKEQQQMGASMVKYAFDHAKEHTGLHVWLSEEYGLDRRDEDEE